ncbi:putative plant SNARE 13 [Camellia lanceoleosa]|uniref:Plant SNARE 13 n=1 Tax=Camellia lanceoleosa TaxID=1840588 RepID=A0ACC0HZ05_9ERIC|nr:putative plant SNARE 13 [Camellia lanceoleosa]
MNNRASTPYSSDPVNRPTRPIGDTNSSNRPTPSRVFLYVSSLGNKRVELFDMGAGTSDPTVDDNVQMVSVRRALIQRNWKDDKALLKEDEDDIIASVQRESQDDHHLNYAATFFTLTNCTS